MEMILQDGIDRNSKESLLIKSQEGIEENFGTGFGHHK